MKRLVPAVLSLLVFAFPVWAGDLVAQWRQADGARFSLTARDDHHVRLDSQEDSYMLLAGEKVYAVSRQNGQWQATDLAQMAKMFCGLGSGSGSTPAYEAVYQPTGRKEKVAGYQGTVYMVEVRDEKGSLVEKKEMVLSDHRDVVRINQAWVNLVSGMGQAMGGQMSKALNDAAKTAAQSGYGGVLRVGGDLVLASLKEAALGAGYFSIPASSPSVPKAVQAPAVTSTAASGAKKTKAAQSAEENNDGAVSQAAKSVGKEIGGVAAREAKSATINEVRDGVKGLFKNLFD